MNSKIIQCLKSEATAGALLFLATVLALFAANFSYSNYYQQFIHLPISLHLGKFSFAKPLEWWINDGLMAFFFLMVGIEVKQECLTGSLASRAQATLPLLAAVGGMLFPGLIYLLLNASNKVAHSGWAIPVATDIAFSLGVIAFLHPRIPIALKTFLLALAIADDLGVIVIIAIFYTEHLSFQALGLALVIIILLVVLNILQINRLTPYLCLGLILWLCILNSGIHATLAGVIVGFIIPINTTNKRSMAKHLAQLLYPWVTFLILPLFAFTNAGVPLEGVSIGNLLNPIPLGIVLSLVFGKPLGITGISWLAIRLKLAKLPDGIRFSDIAAISVVCGIGFTMSMFITNLAFASEVIEYSTYARLGILVGSTIAALSGYCLLYKYLPKNTSLPNS